MERPLYLGLLFFLSLMPLVGLLAQKNFPSPLNTQGIDYSSNSQGNFLLHIQESSSVSFPLYNALNHFRTNSKILLTDESGEPKDSLVYRTSWNDMPDTNYTIVGFQANDTNLSFLLNENYYKSDTIRWANSYFVSYSADLKTEIHKIALPDSFNFTGGNYIIHNDRLIVVGLSEERPRAFLSKRYVSLKVYHFDTEEWTQYYYDPQVVFNGGPHVFGKIYFNPLSAKYFWCYTSGQSFDLIQFDVSGALSPYTLFSEKGGQPLTRVEDDNFIFVSDLDLKQIKQKALIIDIVSFNLDHIFDIGLTTESEDNRWVPKSLKTWSNGDLAVAIENRLNNNTTSAILLVDSNNLYDLYQKHVFVTEHDFAISNFTLIDKDSSFTAFGTTNTDNGKIYATLILEPEFTTSISDHPPTITNSELIKNTIVEDILYLKESNLTDFKLVNAAGQVVLIFSKSVSKEIDLTHLNPGMYHAFAKNRQGEFMEAKFIKN